LHPDDAQGNLFPTISANAARQVIKANFGAKTFLFDLSRLQNF